MNAILKIGRLKILLPSEAKAMAALSALSKGILVDSQYTELNGKYQYVYEVEKNFELEMEIKILAPSATIIDCRKGRKQLRLNRGNHTPTAEEEMAL